ncbi:MAG: hypothetical protein ACI87W_003023 [Halieaceae bacterium]|jgi:hypothetical protein
MGAQDSNLTALVTSFFGGGAKSDVDRPAPHLPAQTDGFSFRKVSDISTAK